MKQRRIAILVAAIALTLVSVAALSGGALGDGDAGLTYIETTDTNDTDVAPGEQFAGSVGAGAAEAEADIDVRAFDRRVDSASNESERARVVASELDRSETRLAELTDRKASLEAALEDGTISEREYRVRITRLAAETAGIERTTNKSATVASGIPNETLAANGVDSDRIVRLQTDARELRGGEVAAIARGIAGDGIGGAPGAPAGERGPPSDLGQASEAGPGAGNQTAGSSGEAGERDGDRPEHERSDRNDNDDRDGSTPVSEENADDSDAESTTENETETEDETASNGSGSDDTRETTTTDGEA